MNRLVTLALIIVMLVVANTAVYAKSNPALAHQSKVITLLHKEVTRSEVRELKLKGDQYLQLQDLQEKYQQELETINTALMNNAPMVEVRKQELDKRYCEELSKVLDADQIVSFLNQTAIADASR